MPRTLVAVLVLLAITLGAWAESSKQVEVAQAWARATPPGMTMGVVYLTLRSQADDQLLGASTPIATSVEMHESSMSNGVMTMRPLTVVELARGSTVNFEPSGKHFMLIGLSRPLQAGESFPLTLKFAKAGMLKVTVDVRKGS
jgi:copper(I)-binding protein